MNSFSDGREAKSIKADGALHYRISDKIEALYNYRYGGGSSIYQGTENTYLETSANSSISLKLNPTTSLYVLTVPLPMPENPTTYPLLVVMQMKP